VPRWWFAGHLKPGIAKIVRARAIEPKSRPINSVEREGGEAEASDSRVRARVGDSPLRTSARAGTARGVKQGIHLNAYERDFGFHQASCVMTRQ